MTKGKGGRPTKLTPERKAKFFKALRDGASIQLACDTAGFAYATVAEWRQIGEGRHPEKEATPLLREFSEETTRALADSELALLGRVRAASYTDWRAASWILERRFSDRWANTQRIELEVQKRIQSEVSVRLEAQVSVLFERIMKDDDIPLEMKKKMLEHAVSLDSTPSKGE